MKSEKDRMDIVSAYEQVGSFRGAAELCGTTHKTVKRVIEDHRGGFLWTGLAGRHGSRTPMGLWG